jgi:hypothetical protein
MQQAPGGLPEFFTGIPLPAGITGYARRTGAVQNCQILG